MAKMTTWMKLLVVSSAVLATTASAAVAAGPDGDSDPATLAAMDAARDAYREGTGQGMDNAEICLQASEFFDVWAVGDNMMPYGCFANGFVQDGVWIGDTVYAGTVLIRNAGWYAADAHRRHAMAWAFVREVLFPFAMIVADEMPIPGHDGPVPSGPRILDVREGGVSVEFWTSETNPRDQVTTYAFWAVDVEADGWVSMGQLDAFDWPEREEED